jgi:toxin YoeB
MNATTAITVFAKTVVRERKIPFEITAPDDLFWSKTNQQHLRKAIGDIQAGKYSPHELIKDIDRNLFEGIGKPEPLKYEYQGYWSRRIDEANRLIYRVENETIIIAQCRTHYEK